jgi:hypothetical protein
MEFIKGINGKNCSLPVWAIDDELVPYPSPVVGKEVIMNKEYIGSHFWAAERVDDDDFEPYLPDVNDEIVEFIEGNNR